jgi:hypothetical protein
MRLSTGRLGETCSWLARSGHLVFPPNTLHVWAWKDNPNGTFTNWNPSVSCDGFSGQ